jgi:hypothetical protein
LTLEKEEADLLKHQAALGVIFSIFKSLDFLKAICYFLIIMSFFFQVPLWCYSMGKDILSGCVIDENRVEYYTTSFLTLRMKDAFYLSWGCQIFLIASQIFGLLFATQRVFIVRVAILSFCLVADIISGALLLNKTITLAVNAYFKIAFIIVYSQTLRKGMVKLVRSLKETLPAILFLLVNLIVFSGIAFILFYGRVDLIRYTSLLRQQPQLHLLFSGLQKKHAFSLQFTD